MFENIMRARETRARSPAFQAEMARESAEFKTILTDLGKNTLKTGFGLFVKGPATIMMNTVKAVYKKEAKDKYWENAFKLAW